MVVAAATLPGVLQTGIHAARPVATAVASGAIYACSTHGLVYQSDGTTWSTWATLSTPAGSKAAEIVIDGAGAAITAGIKGDLEVPFACTITGWRVLADQAGAIAIGVWKDSYANFPPVVGDLLLTATIAATNAKAEATGLSHAVAAGDILRFNVNALATTITRVTISLTLVPA